MFEFGLGVILGIVITCIITSSNRADLLAENEYYFNLLYRLKYWLHKQLIQISLEDPLDIRYYNTVRNNAFTEVSEEIRKLEGVKDDN